MKKDRNLKKVITIHCTIIMSVLLIGTGIILSSKNSDTGTENIQSDLEYENKDIPSDIGYMMPGKTNTGQEMIEETPVEIETGDITPPITEYLEITPEITRTEDVTPQPTEPEVTNIEDVPEVTEMVEVTPEPDDKMPEPIPVLITPMAIDERIISDKYNTGCKGNLTVLDGETSIEGITVTYSGENMVFDFFYKNTEAAGEYVIKNYDFSKHPISVYHESEVTDKKIKLIFKNCRFSNFSTGRQESEVFSYEFINCSLNMFAGSNTLFSKCAFGGSYYDGIVPFSNITVKDSYFSNFVTNDPKGNGQHTDGTQMYGNADTKVQNVHFKNCRFEIPAIQLSDKTSYINACIMLQMEFNDAKNVVVEDCLINGGGYSIYAWAKKDDLSLSKVYFRNLKIGSAKLFGNVYPKIDENVVFDNVSDQDSLYVSSVWNDGGKTHIIVSNDTGQERVLRVVTGNGTKDYAIEPCLGGKELRYDTTDQEFEDFPFDIDIAVEKSNDYVICFDVTDGYEKQIRYVSFDGNPTYYIMNNSISGSD